MDEKRQRISEKAYFQWEREGRPEGREQDHWLQAEGELGRQEVKQGKAKKTARPRAAKAANKTTKKKTSKRAVKKKAK